MGVKAPNIMTCHHNAEFGNDIYIISEECGKEPAASLGELPDDISLRTEIAKIIYIADLLGLGDIAMDNIIQSDSGLFLIDFEALNTNKRFPPQNPFGDMGENKYSIARSFDLHNTKGQIQKPLELPVKGALNDLTLDEESKKQIEERFFSLSPNILNEMISSILKTQFPVEFIEKDLPEIVEEFTSRYVELKKSRKHAQEEEHFENVEQRRPTLDLYRTKAETQEELQTNQFYTSPTVMHFQGTQLSVHHDLAGTFTMDGLNIASISTESKSEGCISLESSDSGSITTRFDDELIVSFKHRERLKSSPSEQEDSFELSH